MLAFAPRVQVAMLAFAGRVQVAIQTGTQLRSQRRRECPETAAQTYSGPVSLGIHVSATNEIGRLGSTGRTRNVTSAVALPVRRVREGLTARTPVSSAAR